ncbi:uncharacterized protein LOC135081236, partial [Ostrinia nubilalis]|uniref:uncharacterized protein LOC135081236 n=1 Tax=Ostrinia nubilalis TaxID=29057 RepID=UPI003082577F
PAGPPPPPAASASTAPADDCFLKPDPPERNPAPKKLNKRKSRTPVKCDAGGSAATEEAAEPAGLDAPDRAPTPSGRRPLPIKSPDTIVDGENLTRDPSPEGDGNDSSLRSVDAPERDPAVSEENSHPIKSDATPIKREPPADEPVAGSSANVPAPSASAEARKLTRAPAAPAPRTLRSATRRAATSVTYLYEVPVETVAPGDFEKHIPAQKRARNSRSNARLAGPLEPPARNAPALASENNEAAPEPPPSRNLRSTTLSRSAPRPIEVEVPKLDPPKRKRGRPKLQKTIDAERDRERKRRIRAEASALRRLLIESQKRMKQNSRKKNARKSRDLEVDFPAAASQSTVKNMSDSVESKQSEPLDLSKRINNNGSELLKILTDPQIHSNKRKQHLLLQKRIKQEMIDEHYEKTASNEANKSISWHIPDVSLPSIKQEFATPRTQQSTIKKESEHPIIPSDFDKENVTTDQVEVHQQLMTSKVINQQLHEIHVPNAVKNLQELPHPYDTITQKQYHNGKQIKQELVDQQIEKSTTIDAQIQSSWHFPENNEHGVAIERFGTPSIDHEYVTLQTAPQTQQHSIKQEPSEYPNIPIEIDEVTEITNRVEVHRQLVNGEEIHTQLQEIHVQNTIKDATITQKQQLQEKPIKQEMIDQQFKKSITVDAQKRTSCHLPEENKYHVNIEQRLIKQEQPEYPDIPIEFDEIMTDQLEGHKQSTNREPIHSQSQEVHVPKTIKSNREIFLEIQHTHDSLTQMQQLHEKQTKQVTKEQLFEKYAIDAHKSGSWHRPQEKEYHVNVEHLKAPSIPQEDLTQQAAPQMQQHSIKQEQPDLPTIPIEFDEVNEMTDQLELRQRSIKQEITHPQCHVQNADKEELVINLESQNTHSHYITQKRLLQEFQQIKQKLIDPQSEKPATGNTHKSNSWHLTEEINHQKDFEHFKAPSARHENVTRHTTPQIQPYSMKQESSVPQIIPIEFDEVKDVTDQLEVGHQGHQSIDRNMYQESNKINLQKRKASQTNEDI